MILRAWHGQIAKMVAQGMRNKDIMKVVKISPSWLSVLKSRPEFQQEVDRWMQIIDEAEMREIYETHLKEAIRLPLAKSLMRLHRQLEDSNK